MTSTDTSPARPPLAIKLTNIVQHYGVRPVLRGINLEIPRGDLVAIMGPNGTGKSSLLGVMAGIISPISGLVEIEGMRRRGSIAEEVAIRRQVIYLPDQPWLPLQRTGREWLMAVGKLYDISDDRLMGHVEALLQVFDLTPQADSAISSYSTGQRKKLGLCSALVAEVPILLMDEPFSGGLDPSGLLVLKTIFQHLAKRSDRTVVFATPVPELVEEVAERILIMRDGQIAAFDTPRALRGGEDSPAELAETYARLTNPVAMEKLHKYFSEFGA